MKLFRWLRVRLRHTFVAGLAVLVPLFVAWFTVFYIVRKVDSFVIPWVIKLLVRAGVPSEYIHPVPGAGLVVTVILIFLVGIFATNFFGKKLVSLWEHIMEHIPGVRVIHTAAKQLVLSVADSSDPSKFSKVVMVEYPRRGIYSLGFVTNEVRGELPGMSNPSYTVFIPTSPNPTSGMMIVVPQNEVVPLPLTVEEGIRVVVSGGVIPLVLDGSQAENLKVVPTQQ